MKRLIFMSALLALLATACKTSEQNYRQAYEKAVAGRDSVADFESTVYGRYRRQMREELKVIGSDTVEVRVQTVAVTPEGGGVKEYLKPYSIVVGQFKQLFNAQSLRQRLVDAGYARTFIVNTPEPYYFIVLDSYATLAEASDAMERLNLADDFPVVMKSPLPFILQGLNPSRRPVK